MPLFPPAPLPVCLVAPAWRCCRAFVLAGGPRQTAVASDPRAQRVRPHTRLFLTAFVLHNRYLFIIDKLERRQTLKWKKINMACIPTTQGEHGAWTCTLLSIHVRMFPNKNEHQTEHIIGFPSLHSIYTVDVFLGQRTSVHVTSCALWVPWKSSHFFLLAFGDGDHRKYPLRPHHTLTSWAPLKVLRWPITNSPPETRPRLSCDYEYVQSISHCQGDGQLLHHGNHGNCPGAPQKH